MESNRPDHSEEAANAPSSFLWAPAGKGLSVYLDFDVVDRMSGDIMRGFGAVPRRGAEVGGILLGYADTSNGTVIHIEDYALLPCEHLRGPSYILSETDLKSFDQALREWGFGPDKRISAIGFFRSNTRDTLQLAAEDMELLDSRFRQEGAMALLVRPYATRVSEAAFFFRRGGQFPIEPAEDILPFRRKDLGGGKPARRTRANGDGTVREGDANGQTPETPEAAGGRQREGSTQVAAETGVPHGGRERRIRGSWFWVTMSLVFLLLGTVLGFQVALTYFMPGQAQPKPDPFALELNVVESSGNLHLKWNTGSPAFERAVKAVLEIKDGDSKKTVDLSRDDLRRGGVLYRNLTGQVGFRLEVFPTERTSVSESVDVKLFEPPKQKK